MTHLLASPADVRAVCGVKAEAAPTVALAHAQAHVDGHGLAVCAACQEATGGHRWPTGEPSRLFEP